MHAGLGGQPHIPPKKEKSAIHNSPLGWDGWLDASVVSYNVHYQAYCIWKCHDRELRART